MIIPYALRLLCLCLASFFLIHLALSAIARALSPLVLRAAGRMAARAAAMLLFTLRLLPAVLALATVGALCLPSFVSFESERGSEAAGFPFLAAAAVGASIWALSIARSLRAIIRSSRCISRLPSKLAGESEAVWLWEGAHPFIGLAGILRPRVVVSRSVTNALDADQLAAALRHERAHRASADNLKRLLLLLAPEPLPCLSLFRGIDRAWARFAEWAADDWAAGEDARRSISLAEALVRVARLGAAPRTSPLVSPFVPADDDISTRVDRLLNGPAHFAAHFGIVGPATFASLLAAPFTIAALAPGALSAIHQLLERLMH